MMLRAALLLGAAATAQAACADETTQTTCAGAGCQWNPIWGPSLGCVEDPCRTAPNEQSCLAVAEVVPFPCSPPPGDPEYCTLSVCAFDVSAPQPCKVQECLMSTSATCTGTCTWSVPNGVDALTQAPADQVKHCKADDCGPLGQTDCDARGGCKWTGACVRTLCGEHQDEAECDHDLKCHWDVSQATGVCGETTCGEHTDEGVCDTQSTCMWTTRSGQSACVAKTCDKYNDPVSQCGCSEDSDCTWHAGPPSYCADPKFSACPDLDIAFVLDGSGSMRRSFGRHAHGFYGLMEILRDWMNTVPLTGDDHTAGGGAKTNTGAFRITFIQFSMAEATPADDHPTNCAIGACTNGLLSGMRSELHGDIDWHEANYQGQWTYLHDALKDVADNTFLPANSPPERQHVVILIADGGITDIDGDACCADRCGGNLCVDRNWKPSYPGILDAAQAKLRTEDVTVFGIVMRRFDYHTFQDDNAETKLKPLVSEPVEEHFMNLMLDEIPDSVLNTFCDPNSKFGQKVVGSTTPLGCGAKGVRADCESQVSCVWDDAKSGCVESVCYKLCTEVKCDTNPLCTWNAGADRCDLTTGCTAKDETACKNDDTCLWDPIWATNCIDNPCVPHDANHDTCVATSVTMPAPCDTTNTNVDFCTLEVCDHTSVGPDCEVKKCLQISKTTCEQEDGCVWNGPDPVDASVSPSDKVHMCTPVPCSHTLQPDCDADTDCKWDAAANPKCVPTDECKALTLEEDCDKNTKCHWNVAATPDPVCELTECAPIGNQPDCDKNDKCMWTDKDVCVPKTCDKHTDHCPCDADPDCVWHHTANGGFCTDPNFNTCPDLDIAFVLDGSGSMRRSFGRHAHGFYGLMEILRDWMKTVPLTGDDHTVGANAARDKGFRITFIQFSKAEAKAADDHPTNCAIGACTNGLLSGMRSELHGDIDWHEANYQGQWTYLHDALKDVADNTFLPANSPSWREHVVIIIADGGITDIDGDACCADRCGNNLCIDRNFDPSYPGILTAAQTKLRSEDVTVFGIVMRRFDYHTFQDDNAEIKLKPLVSTPTDTHFMNLMLDEIPDSVLNTFCDANSKFGQNVAKPTGCDTNLEQALCVADKSCMWDTTCKDSVCYPKCDETTCKMTPACDWQNDECIDVPTGCVGKDQTACQNDDTCLWDPIWADACIDNPCIPPTAEPDCLAVSVTMPSPCDAPNADPDFCILDVCHHDATKMPVCEVKKCLQISKTTCEKEDGCVWNGPDPVDATTSPSTLVDMCSPVPCNHALQPDCDADTDCKWDAAANPKCVPTDECQKLTKEEECDHNTKCHWNVAATPDPVCEQTVCAPIGNQPDCDKNDKCMWTDKDVCVPKTCDKHTDHCPCDADPDCVWHHTTNGAYCTDPNFNTCPDLDIAFVLDGSGSMRRSFGRHAHGFYGLMEILRDWMNTVPLTGDDHTVGANAARDKGFRITFIQFSKAEATAADDHPTNCAIGACTNGLLSGMRSELHGDIDWHEANYQGQWTYLHDALKDVADNTFLPANSPSWREHVVIIIADGGITDIDGDACCSSQNRCGGNLCVDRKWKASYPGILSDAQQKLRDEDVTVFGIVMRRFDQHTFQDDNAETKLTPLVSEPTYDHFMNLMLDEIPDSVLNTFCDANSKFGKVVTQVKIGCDTNLEQALCVADKSCMWDTTCKDSVCYPKCDETTCKMTPACDWQNDECIDVPTGCVGKDQTACQNDDTCLWDPIWADACIDNPCIPPTAEPDCLAVSVTMPSPCDAPNADPDFCKLDVCHHDATKMPVCEVKKCLQISKTTCEKEDGCVWTGPDPVDATTSPSNLVAMCSPVPCNHALQPDCDADTDCKWDAAANPKCVPTDECQKLTKEEECDHNTKCHWNVAATPDPVCEQTECAPIGNQPDCDKNDKCMWTDKDVCEPKTCEKHDTRCPCQDDPDCVWHHGAPGYCEDKRYEKCPDLDIAFVLDGSGSMRRSFGRHAHGFYGLMEILRDWMKTVPLTGDDHTVGGGAKTNTGAFRITFIQFSKAEATPAEDHPTNCAIGACTNGLLSGMRSELHGDIDWHEANYQAQWTYLHDALLDVADHTFLPANSPPERTHVVILIADGGITDIDGDACCSSQNRCGGGLCVDRRWKPTYPGILEEAQQKLHAEDVTVFGIVMRRFDQHTFQDDNAEIKLKPLVSEPQEEHFMNLMLDEIPDSVLNTFCDPNSKFGLKVAIEPKKCADLNATTCAGDDACTYNTASSACEDSICYPLCIKGDCDLNPQCYWGNDECKLTPLTPVPDTDAPPTQAPPTDAPATSAPATPLPPTPAPPTEAPKTPSPPTDAPATSAPPTAVPPPVPVDECVDAGGNDVCAAKGQVCRDADQSALMTWECMCPPPLSHIAKPMGLADCTFDECTDSDVVCKAQGQTCVDTDKDKTGTWACECIPPQTGATTTGAPAICKDPEGDCDKNGATCHAAGQSCDPGAPLDQQFECKCIPPATTVTPGQNGAAECKLDECVEKCPTCADKDDGKGNVCTSATGPPQECEDLNTDPNHLNDWRCKCVKPYTGVMTTAPAECTLDECQEKCPTCADKDDGSGNVCDGAGQTCVEHNIRNLSDWECVCVDPKVGRKWTDKADCTEDECRSNQEICVKAGQACVDKDLTKNDDWECQCPPPSTTVMVAGVAVCEADECSVEENKKKCEDAGQVCVDPSATTNDDWECHCPPPSTGSQKTGPAVPCTLDECVAVCPSCSHTAASPAKGVCEGADQVCHDPVTTASSLNDWTCTCKTSTKSAVTSAVAVCVDGKDECLELSSAVTCKHKPRYTQEGCLCACDWTATFKDGNGNVLTMPPGPGSTEPCASGCCNPQSDPVGDWCYLAVNDYNTNKGGVCTAKRQTCSAAGTLPQDGGVAAVRDPIAGVPSAQNNVCTDAGQLCVEPDLLTTDDWMCKCVPPMTGTPGQQAIAICAEDECSEHGAVCHAQNQKCIDPDTTKKDDWMCECTTGAKTTQVAGAAVCPLDECVEICPSCATDNGTDVCSVVGQECEDPSPKTDSLNDWVCKCPPPSLGTNIGGPVAKCVLDECVVVCTTCADKDGKGNLCESAGQTCEDPDKDVSSTNDWMCKCKAPSHTTAVANIAKCEEDECEVNGVKCTQGQLCVDPDQLNSNDWYCECVAPATGSQVGGAALCEEDECKQKGEVCVTSGQTCTDPDTTVLGNWVCECIAPDTGNPGQQKPAFCTPVDVCKDGGDKVCAAAGQHCEKKSGTDYQCGCIAPYTGTAVVGGVAVCTLDECVATCASCEKDLCTLHGQECEDPDTTKSNDWMCKCVAPSTGLSLVGAAAVCILDECVAECGTCEKDECSKVGQICEDASTHPLHVSDWLCKCPPPSTNARTGGAVPSCTFDECTANGAVCTDAQQVCVDPDLKTTGNWECHCPPPASGSAPQGPAASCTLNECTAKCVTCADSGKGNVCAEVSQECVDPDHGVASNWYCKCKVGSSYQMLGAVPVCIVDECSTECDTCANKGGGNVCEADGQTCVDTNQGEWQTGDWECVCPPPLSFITSKNGPAVCGVDECVDAINGATLPAGHICAQEGQVCHDSHLDTLNDFDCVCVKPKQGTKTNAVATCTTDECLIHGDKCKKEQQTCVDPDVMTLNTWECVCPPPSSSVQKQGVAVCEVDECVDNRYICEQATPVQQCVDTNKTALGNWECVCSAPSSGSGQQKEAVCMLNECDTACATCEQMACRAAGQTCVDPNPTFASLSDWMCKCPPPSTQSAIANVASCPVDECDRASHVCAASKQTCLDPDTSADSLSDWQCHCQAPASGQATKGPALCLVDECKTHGHVCTTHGQVCLDEHKGEYSLNDWVCQCAPPLHTNAVGTQGPAECVMVGECEDPVNSDVCTSAGQVCDDPDETTKGDWRCLCVMPATGTPGAGAAAVCLLDECVSQCPTCAGSVCTNAGQTCADTDKDPLTGLNSWECRCIAPASGSKLGAAAVCLINECDVHRSTCNGAGQDCVDDNTALTGDWRCVCRSPATGSATADAAKCIVDECNVHRKECEDAGQICFDKNKEAASLSDWQCQCVAPQTGVATKQPANCTVDECDLYGDVCRSAGQTCVDTELEIEGFWKCTCPPPNDKVTREGGKANCEVLECKMFLAVDPAKPEESVTAVNFTEKDKPKPQNVCEAAGQTCVEGNTSYTVLGDWACQCPESTQVAIGHAAVCETDECAVPANADVCVAVGQLCVDVNFTTSDDWECRCPPPSVGDAGAKAPAAACVVDECVTHEENCHAFGQVCVDPTPTEASLGDWECHCVPGSKVNASAVMSKADCTPAESECAAAVVSEVCTKKGQVCVDPDTTKPFDWECQCIAPATGDAGMQTAASCVLDECEETCPSCEKDLCRKAGQNCVDANKDGSSLHDWACVCSGKATGQAKGVVAVCEVDECAVECHSCADTGNGDGNVCTTTDTVCFDPNKDARSSSDWMCMCKPPAVGNRTLAIPVCIVDECVRLSTEEPACGDGQTCTDPNTSPVSLNDFMCTCPEPQTGTGLGLPAHCILNECNIQKNFDVCKAAGQVCIDPVPTPTSLQNWECHCADGGVFEVAKAAVCVLDECVHTCDTCADSGAGNACTLMGQTCQDPVKTVASKNDWTCTCPGGDLSATGRAAVCMVDECAEVTNYGAVTCNEVPRKTVDGCECQCNWRELSLVGSGPGLDSDCVAGCCNPTGRAGGAWCIVEDNAANRMAGCPVGGTLEERMQTCVLPAGSAVAAAAEAKCGAGQVCVDPNTAAKNVGDWRCECIAPAYGESAVGVPAKCVTDECLTNFETCAAVGQLCVDTEGSDNWKCVCPKGASGEGVKAPATCSWTGECDVHAEVCTQVGQTCFDPDTTVTGDWVCQCVEPATGVSARAAPATCKLNECTAQCATCADKGAGNVCEEHGQRCEETSTSPADVLDWRCVCPTGMTGSKSLAPAKCLVDECQSNGGVNAQVCGASGQSCVDPNATIAYDWRCVCPPPSLGQATGRVAACVWDECLEAANAQVCANAGQLCVDANTDINSKNDWMCVCPETPADRGVVGAPAVCKPGSWCQAYGKTCSARGQICVPEMAANGKDTTGRGRCDCMSPQTGEPGAFSVEAPAADALTCVLDECVAQCVTCAVDATGKTMCEAAGQTCVEGSTDPAHTRDWRCECAAAVGGKTSSAVASVAACAVAECEGAGAVCGKSDQACVDPDVTKDDDWFCECHDPAVGKKLGGVAVCTFDECIVNEKTCAEAGQMCFDKDMSPNSRGDWWCSCPATASGEAAQARPAVCTFTEECATKAISDVCTNMGQTCVDLSPATGDWTCACVSPQTGEAKVAAPAVCHLDECAVSCGTCATVPGSKTHACLSANQLCEDANTDPASTGDWWCKCQAPSVGSQRAAAAACQVDECAIPENAMVCKSMLNNFGKSVQLCVDRDTTVLGDWMCECSWPYTGQGAVGELAQCQLDECTVPATWNGGKANGGEICSQAGQHCLDSKKDSDSLDNWVCQCENPNDGSKIGGPAPTCAVTTLCAANGAACGAGQVCKEKDNDWYCECSKPLAGEMLNGPAVCVLDECTQECTGCAKQALSHICLDAGQACVDKNTSPDSREDWACMCQDGAGEKIGAAAVCAVNECVIHGVTCESAGQDCADASADNLNDWSCICRSPASGAAMGGVASCVLDECHTSGKVCIEVGQTCQDSDTAATSLGDWVCECPAGSTGSMPGGVATCVYTDACDVEENRQTCISVGQKCVGGADAADVGAWRCACIAPFHGEMGVKQAASCMVDECTDICPTCARTGKKSVNVCTAAGQTCTDPDTSATMLSNWMCMCEAPALEVAVAKAVDACTIDECTAVTNKGARQCGHFSRFTTDGCECACGWTAMAEGGNGDIPGMAGPGYSEPCTTACCNPDESATGDWCFLADSAYNKGKDQCKNLIAQRQTCTFVTTPAPADAPAAAKATNVCVEKNQICVDLDKSPTVSGDWECRCPFSEGKQALAPVATCEYNECTNVTICSVAGQTCRDSNPTEDSLNDWECVCQGSSTGEATGAVATCSMVIIIFFFFSPFPLFPSLVILYFLSLSFCHCRSYATIHHITATATATAIATDTPSLPPFLPSSLPPFLPSTPTTTPSSFPHSWNRRMRRQPEQVRGGTVLLRPGRC